MTAAIARLRARRRGALGRDGIVLGLATALGSPPLAFDPLFLLEPNEGWIQGPLIQHERVIGQLLKP